MRIRTQNTYKAFFTNSYKTVRLTDGHPLTPELEDVAINAKCYANCTYCYTSAVKEGMNFTNVIEKADEVWGRLSLNDRPFQIAIGGAGEPTLHPDFISFIKKVKQLDIVPNYTTNGMHLNDSILEATEMYCGGVALSYHPHIKPVYTKAMSQLSSIKTKLNTHVIISDDTSFNDLLEIVDKYNAIDYFVLLPYQAVGRAKEINVIPTWDKLFNWIASLETKLQNKFAFGALFYNYIISKAIPFKMSIYNPDVYSGYRLMNENYKTVYRSSYDLTEKSISYQYQ